MIRRALPATFAAAVVFGFAACKQQTPGQWKADQAEAEQELNKLESEYKLPGQPVLKEVVLAPTKVTSFEKLYKLNCRGCHGADGTFAGSISMNDQTYLAVATPDVVRGIIANGVPNTLMPAFSQENGGVLTDAQVDILVKGIFAWKKAGPATLPAYSAPPGDAAAGKVAYDAYADALRKVKPQIFEDNDGFMTNPAFLGLSSDQYLRTLLITGRPELGIPNFQDAIPGQPLSDQQISDIVAWLISQRKNEFGQPLVPAQQ